MDNCASGSPPTPAGLPSCNSSIQRAGARLGRPSKQVSAINAIQLQEVVQSQIVSRLSNCSPVRKILVEMGKKVTLPDLKHMAYAHILDVMNDDKIKPQDRLGYCRLVFELDGELGAQRGEVKHKHMLEFSEGTRELLAARIKEMMEGDTSKLPVIDVVAEGEPYATLAEKSESHEENIKNHARIQGKRTAQRKQEGPTSEESGASPGNSPGTGEKETEIVATNH